MTLSDARLKALSRDGLEALRSQVDQVLRAQPDEDERRWGWVHLYGVAQAAALLALRRGLDVRLAMAAGMLHDIATYRSGDANDHAARSAREARPMLEALQALAATDVDAICQAIACHSAKDRVDAPLGELLKDADVLQHYLYHPQRFQAYGPEYSERLAYVLAELGVNQ